MQFLFLRRVVLLSPQSRADDRLIPQGRHKSWSSALLRAGLISLSRDCGSHQKYCQLLPTIELTIRTLSGEHSSRVTFPNDDPRQPHHEDFRGLSQNHCGRDCADLCEEISSRQEASLDAPVDVHISPIFTLDFFSRPLAAENASEAPSLVTARNALYRT